MSRSQLPIHNTAPESMQPSPLVIQWAPYVAQTATAERRALDVASGTGRNAEALSRCGYRVFGVDMSLQAIRHAASRPRPPGESLRLWCADLTTFPLPRARFDLVLVARYLQRDLFPALKEAALPGGVVIYETFTRRQLQHGRGPTSANHLLESGELPSYFTDFDLLFYEERDEPDALASLVARRRM